MHLSLSILSRSEGSIHHNLIVATQRPNPGFTLNNITSQVLYKVIHYFMENPINGNTVLKHPVQDRDVSTMESQFTLLVRIPVAPRLALSRVLITINSCFLEPHQTWVLRWFV